MENFNKMSHLDKAVGIPSNNEDWQTEFEELLTNKFIEGGKKYDKYEIEKTEKDIQLINFTQNAVDNYLKKYGRKKEVNIPLENIHVLSEGGVKEITGGKQKTGIASIKYGEMFVDREKTDTMFSLVTFHELMHLKSFTAMQVTKGETKEEREIGPYRAGFSVTTRDGKKTYFSDVNEAIVGFLSVRFFQEYIEKNELFKNELQKMKEEKTPVDFGRGKETQAGLEAIKKIYKKNEGKYSVAEIMDTFIDAGINGNLIKVARLIEETFGKGSFRKFGEGTGVINN